MNKYSSAIVDELVAISDFFEITASDIKNNFYILETKQTNEEKIKIYLVITDECVDLSIYKIPEFSSWNLKSQESCDEVVNFIKNIIFNEVIIVSKKILFISFIDLIIGKENIKIIRFFDSLENGKWVFKPYLI